MSPRRFDQLSQRERRGVVLKTVAFIVAAWVLILGLYSLLSFADLPGAVLPGLFVGLAVFVGVLDRQAHRILASGVPEARAAQALGAVVPLYLVLFAGCYLAMSLDEQSNFSEPLDHTTAFYFAVTVFATVGFGDITPTTDVARAVVSVQMLVNLVLLGALARFLLGRARAALEAKSPPPST